MAADALVTAFALVNLTPLLSPVAYFVAERAHRASWQTRPLPPQALVTSAYRSGGPIVTGYRRGAPPLVRFAAFTSIAFGAMFVPGFVWGFIGLFAMGFGLLSIPGLFVCASLWRIGHALLRGDADAAPRARRTALLSLCLNVPIFVAAALGVLVVQNDDLVAMAAFTGIYAILSIVQALVLRRAASALDTIEGAFHDGTDKGQR